MTERITEETTAEKQAADAEWASITENEPAAKREGNRESDTRPMADERTSASERATDEHTSERAADMDSGRMTNNGTAAKPEQPSTNERVATPEQATVTEEVVVAERVSTARRVPVTEPASDAERPATSERLVASEQTVVAAPVESLDPTGRPMEQAIDTTPVPARRKKKGVLFGIIGAILLLAGIAAAVVAVVMMMNKPDPVTMAIQKIMSGEAPKNVAIDGNIDILANNPNAFIKRVNIDLDSDIVIGSMINTSSAVLTFTDENDKDHSVKFEEVYAAEGDLFFKIEGAMAALEDAKIMELMQNGSNLLNNTNGDPVTNCVQDASGTTNCAEPVVSTECVGTDDTECVTDGETMVVDDSGVLPNPLLSNAILSVIEAADGVYLRLSSQDVDTISGGALSNSPISCITDLMSTANKGSNSAVELYNKYPFINSSDKNVIISSKQNPIYRISLDSNNLTSFINGIKNTEISSEVYDCLGLERNLSVTDEDIAKIVNQIPTVYAEINSDYNFTRLYLESELEDNSATVTVDLGISYPTNVTVTEPVEYTDFTDMIQTIFMSMYNIQNPDNPVIPTPAE